MNKIVMVVAMFIGSVCTSEAQAGKYYTAQGPKCIRPGVVCFLRKVQPVRRFVANVRGRKPVRKMLRLGAEVMTLGAYQGRCNG